MSNQGWLCPKCGSAHAPHIETCPVAGPGFVPVPHWPQPFGPHWQPPYPTYQPVVISTTYTTDDVLWQN